MLQHFTGNNPAPHEIYRTATQQFHVFAPFFYGQSRSFQSCQYYSPSGASTVTRLKSKSAIHPLLQTQRNDPTLCLVLAVEGLTQVMYVLWRAAFEIFRRLIHLAAGSTHETKRLGARSRGGGEMQGVEDRAMVLYIAEHKAGLDGTGICSCEDEICRRNYAARENTGRLRRDCTWK